MMSNFSLTFPSPLSTQPGNHSIDYGTIEQWCSAISLQLTAIFPFLCVPCILGLLGNGTVIWLLGFGKKKNPVTTYILNLAVADFGILIALILLAGCPLVNSNCENILPFFLIFFVTTPLFHVLFSISQFLLTVISIDRCVAVLFPLWYRCHRPENLSTIFCALIWISCFLVHGICETLTLLRGNRIMLYVLLVDAVVCLPLIMVSTLILVFKFCFKTQQRHRKSLLMAILLALLFFLCLAFPLNATYLMYLQDDADDLSVGVHSSNAGYICASVNSCVNPLIYFLVWRKKRSLRGENLKDFFQRLFKQEEEVPGELQAGI